MKIKPASEKDLQRQICEYLKIRYPKIIFNSDMAGAMKLTMGQAIQIAKLRSSRGFPDIVIYEPRRGYAGLFVELKKEGERIFKKDGSFSSDHVQEQHECITRLNLRGYRAMFAIGWDEAKTIIDDYLK
ncbi:MAG: hypothetical protein NTZ69_15930 [Bacteroidia bacterium]|nr:hypothetical protein [Bacteroidia bacterium]